MKKMGLFDDNDNLKSSDSESIQRLFPGFDITSDDASKCIELANNPDKRGRHGPMETKCSKKAIKLILCFTAHLTIVCPKEKQTQSEHCINTRKWLAKAAKQPNSDEQPPL